MLNWAACALVDRRGHWQREAALRRMAEERREDHMVADMRLILNLASSSARGEEESDVLPLRVECVV